MTRRPRALRSVIFQIPLQALGAWVLSTALAGGFLDSQAPDPTRPEFQQPDPTGPQSHQPDPTGPEPQSYGFESARPTPQRDSQWAPSVTKLENARSHVLETEQNCDKAFAAYQQANIRRYPRGEPFEALRDRVGSTRLERNNAEDEFIELVEELRRAGTPMGLLSPYMNFSDQIQKERVDRREVPVS